MLALIAEDTGQTRMVAALNKDLQLKILKTFKSELAACLADISHAVRGIPACLDILIVIDEVLFFEISNLSSQF